MKIHLKQPYSFLQLGKRTNQEDARFPDEDIPKGNTPFFVVCDGVGGQDKGEVASRTVADAIGRYMQKIDLSMPFTSEDFSRLLEYTYSCIYKKMSSLTREMATTMTFVCFNKVGAFCAHMGDSRIYQVRPGVGIMYQSEDHSFVNAMVHSGNLTPEEAINHPKGNIITRCITYVEEGMEKPSATTIQIADIEAGDYFFLCTDGVTHCVEDSELADVLSSDRTDEEKMRVISEKCKFSSDNNTAYLVGIERVMGDDTVSHINSDTSEYAGTTTAPIDNSNDISKEVNPLEISAQPKLFKFIKKILERLCQ